MSDYLAPPLRAEPVRRDEVMITRRGKWTTITMPAGTYQRHVEKSGSGYESSVFVGDPELWRGLLAELADQFERDYQQSLAWRAEFARTATPEQLQVLPMLGRPERKLLPNLRISLWSACAYYCVHCHRGFLSEKLPGNKLRLCSDRCKRERQRARYQLWRQFNPVNDQRAKVRAEARAGRTCAHCGKPIEAARSTRRFCSDVCRVRAHHQQKRKAADTQHEAAV